jgi:hypothetical protein
MDCKKKLLRKKNLSPAQDDEGDTEEESVDEVFDRLQNADVLDERPVPEESEEEGADEEGEHHEKDLGDGVGLVLGLDNVSEHFEFII